MCEREKERERNRQRKKKRQLYYEKKSYAIKGQTVEKLNLDG